MNKKIALCLALVLVANFMGVFSLRPKAASIGPGTKKYVNMRRYCCEGENGASRNKDNAYKYKRLTANGKTAMPMMFLSDTNTGNPINSNSGNPIWVYCIEFGENIASYNPRASIAKESSGFWNSLSSDAKRGIELASLYGFPNKNLGVPAADAYAATQAVIWEFQTGVRTLGSKERHDSNTRGSIVYRNQFHDIFVENGSYRTGMKAYEALIDEIYAHSVLPSFVGTQIILNFDKNEKKYVAELKDENAVLNRYNISCSNPNVYIDKSMQDKNILMLRTKDKNCVDDFFISIDKSVGNTTTQSLLILEAERYGQSTYLGVPDSEKISTKIYAHVNPLVIKKYDLKIEKLGQELSEFKSEDMSLPNGENLKINFPVYENKKIGDCCLKLYAAEDIITDDGELRNKKDELIKTVTTVEDEDVIIKDLYAGKYYLEEASAKQGFKVKTEKVFIDIGEQDAYNGEKNNVSIQNQREKYGVSFKKEMEGDPDFKNVCFGIYTAEEIGSLSKDSLVDIVYPDENGVCKSSLELPLFHSYYIRELSTGDKHVLSGDIYHFDLDLESISNSSENYIELPIIVFNKLKPEPIPEPKKIEPPQVKVVDETPLSEAPNEIVDTGDNSNALLYGLILIFSLTFGIWCCKILVTKCVDGEK